MVTMPSPPNLEEAAQRSSQNVTASELTRMIGMYEPFSLSKLTNKSHDLHELNVGGGGSGAQRLSPRHQFDGSGSPRNRSNSVNRRSSSHFRELPENPIAESAQDDDDDEEEKEEPRNASPHGTNVGAL